jgi:hypothetical protein
MVKMVNIPPAGFCRTMLEEMDAGDVDQGTKNDPSRKAQGSIE